MQDDGWSMDGSMDGSMKMRMMCIISKDNAAARMCSEQVVWLVVSYVG